MLIYYPSLIASAIFFANIVVNLNDRNYANVLFTSLLAIPTVLFLFFLSQKNLDIIAYILILVPIILVFVGYNMGIKLQQQASILPVIPQQPVVPDRIEPSQGTSYCLGCTKNPCKCPIKN